MLMLPMPHIKHLVRIRPKFRCLLLVLGIALVILCGASMGSSPNNSTTLPSCDEGVSDADIVLHPGQIFNISCAVDTSKLYKLVLRLRFDQLAPILHPIRVLLVDDHDSQIFGRNNNVSSSDSSATMMHFRKAYVNKNWINGQLKELNIFNLKYSTEKLHLLLGNLYDGSLSNDPSTTAAVRVHYSFQLKKMNDMAVFGIAIGVVLVLIFPLIAIIVLLAVILCVQKTQKLKRKFRRRRERANSASYEACSLDTTRTEAIESAVAVAVTVGEMTTEEIDLEIAEDLDDKEEQHPPPTTIPNTTAIDEPEDKAEDQCGTTTTATQEDVIVTIVDPSITHTPPDLTITTLVTMVVQNQ